MKVVFGEPDKMFRLIGEALAPSDAGPKFLQEFFLTESADPKALLRAWSEKRGVTGGIDVVHCDDPPNIEKWLADADVLVIENQKIGADELNGARSLQLIQMFGRDTSNVDVGLCGERGIAVHSLDRHTNRLVAEHVIMLMLALVRGFRESQVAMKQPSPLPPAGWAYNWPACKNVTGLAGRVVGLLGLGQTGSMVAEYLRPFGAKVIYTRRTRDRQVEEKLGLTYVGLDELLATADVISLHVPANEQTKHLVDDDFLRRIKRGVMIVNTARGTVIDEDALLRALRNGTIAGAAMDVFSVEPLPLNHPFQSVENVILTPHVAAGTRDEAWLDLEIGPIIDSIISVRVR
ncbi:MAG: D-isomer specific 2-hydroxyacid dehydrogenase family protein [Alphaproteobacteria bacterium]|nr:D-isomer specific 2-hydroxyacid dehydrogenase family protein [Alphaproteobacteria bacterium]